MNTSVIVQARMGSKRLPGKSLMRLGNHKVIEWVILRLRLCKKITNIILATTENRDDDILCEIAEKNGINYFRGSEKDVLKRFLDAGTFFNVENIVRVCADRPFIDPTLIDSLAEKFCKVKVDLLFNHKSDDVNFWPVGFGAEIFKIKILKEIYSKKISDYYKEHVTLYLYECGDYKIQSENSSLEAINFHMAGRFDLDTKSDLYKLREIADLISIDNSYDSILRIFKKKMKR